MGQKQSISEGLAVDAHLLSLVLVPLIPVLLVAVRRFRESEDNRRWYRRVYG